MPDQAVGPIDFVLLEFPGDADTSAASDALMDLVERDLVHIYDLLAIRKELDGSFSGMDVSDLTSAGVGGFRQFGGARSGLLADDEIDQAIAVMKPGTIAALIVFENTWAAPFVGATIAAGGEVVATQRIPATDVIAALDSLEGGGSNATPRLVGEIERTGMVAPTASAVAGRVQRRQASQFAAP